MEKELRDKWYLKTSMLVIAILCVGPFALPLLWANPRFSLRTKIIISTIVVILTYFMVVISVRSLCVIKDYYNLLREVY